MGTFFLDWYSVWERWCKMIKSWNGKRICFKKIFTTVTDTSCNYVKYMSKSLYKMLNIMNIL